VFSVQASVTVDVRDSETVKLEYAIEPYRVDVAVVHHETLTAIEVLATHAVPDEKWRELKADHVVEVRANDILHACSSTEGDIEAVRIRGAPLVCTRCRDLLSTTLEFGKHRGKMICDVEPRYLIDYLADSQERVSCFIRHIVENSGCCRSCYLDQTPSNGCWCMRIIAAKTMRDRERVLASSYSEIPECGERSYIYVLHAHCHVRENARLLLQVARTHRQLCVNCCAPLTEVWHRVCRRCYSMSQIGDSTLGDSTFRPIVSPAVVDSLQRSTQTETASEP
jgi:hypothetical protein